MFRCAIFLFLISVQVLAIVGGISTTDPLPSFLTESDRQKIKSHTVVLLNTQMLGMHSRCSATLVASNLILTAAHCVPEKLNDLWVVPSIYEFAVLERRAVVGAIVHRNYKKFDLPKLNQPNDDLALVKFEGVLPNDYRPTSLVTQFVSNQDRFWLYVAGYGVSDEDAGDNGEIRFSRVTIEHYLLHANQSFMVGLQSNGEGICKGDSGGPAYIKIESEFYVLGIVSAIQGGCRGTSYFNQSLYYLEWIKKNIAIANALGLFERVSL